MNTLNIEKRIYALIIDFLIISVFITFISGFINLDSYKVGSLPLLNREWVVNYSIQFLIIMLYYLLFDCFSGGLSLGKKIMKLKIIKYDNTSPSLLEKVLRTILKSFLLFTIFSPLLITYYIFKKDVFYDRILKNNLVVR